MHNPIKCPSLGSSFIVFVLLPGETGSLKTETGKERGRKKNADSQHMIWHSSTCSCRCQSFPKKALQVNKEVKSDVITY